jgi:carbon monoxide dehydrogenase subunit G
MMNDGYTESREISAPAAEVWAMISDLEGLPAVLSGMTALVIEGDDPAPRIGLAWTQTREIAGRTGSERLEITALDDGRRYVTRGGGHGIDYVSTWKIEATGPVTSRLTCTFVGVPRTAFARLLLRLFGGLGAGPTREAMRADLHDIAVATEGVAR